jgi:hypothetical protein
MRGCTLAALLVLGCGQSEVPATAPGRSADAQSSSSACPTGPLPSARAPGVDAEHETLAFWLERVGDLDASLVDEGTRERLRAQAGEAAGGPRDPWAPAIDSASALAQTRERIASLARELADGTNVEAAPGAIADAQRAIDAAEPVDHARLVVGETQMACTPTNSGIYRQPRDDAFDRNLCTTLHPGELVRVLAKAGKGTWSLVHAGHTVGWVREDGLSARLSEDDRIAWRSAERVLARRDDVRTKGGVAVRFGVALPLRTRGQKGITVWVAGPDGPVEDVVLAEDVTVGPAALTRRELFVRAFAAMGDPYGWGGKDGARDCSQFLLDLFAGFGIPLGRHSSVQAMQGTHNVDVAGMAEADKLAAIDDAAARGVVLLYMPGHVMLDVGRAGDRRFAISAIAEYVVPCADGPVLPHGAGVVLGETLYRLDRVAVTDLELGRGSSRGAFIERITRLAIFGPLP